MYVLAADGVDAEKPAKRARGRSKGENKKSSGSVHRMWIVYLSAKLVSPR